MLNSRVAVKVSGYLVEMFSCSEQFLNVLPPFFIIFKVCAGGPDTSVHEFFLCGLSYSHVFMHALTKFQLEHTQNTTIYLLVLCTHSSKGDFCVALGSFFWGTECKVLFQN